MVRNLRYRRSAAGGFTLIEVMVVVVIIGIMAALVVPQFMGRQEQAMVNAARSDLQAISSALEIYKLDNFSYPSTEQGLRALVEKPAGAPEPRNWNPGGYVQKLRDDPWGNPYQYLTRDIGYELYSLGADGVEGGEGYNRDISLTDL